jgi:hypothetical protein
VGGNDRPSNTSRHSINRSPVITVPRHSGAIGMPASGTIASTIAPAETSSMGREERVTNETAAGIAAAVAAGRLTAGDAVETALARFLTAKGTPASGPTLRPAARSASIAAARARARSAVTPVFRA